jgi:hypothetical protein
MSGCSSAAASAIQLRFERETWSAQPRRISVDVDRMGFGLLVALEALNGLIG